MNSITLANATHRGPRKVTDGTSTQVRVQMINRCKVKMNHKGLYKLGDFPQKGGIFGSNLNNLCSICILLRQFIQMNASSSMNTCVLEQLIHSAI